MVMESLRSISMEHGRAVELLEHCINGDGLHTWISGHTASQRPKYNLVDQTTQMASHVWQPGKTA